MNTVLVVLPLLLSSLCLPVVLADPTVTASRRGAGLLSGHQSLLKTSHLADASVRLLLREGVRGLAKIGQLHRCLQEINCLLAATQGTAKLLRRLGKYTTVHHVLCSLAQCNELLAARRHT